MIKMFDDNSADLCIRVRLPQTENVGTKRQLKNEGDSKDENVKKLRNRVNRLEKTLLDEESNAEDDKQDQSIEERLEMLENIVYKKKPATCPGSIETQQGIRTNQIQEREKTSQKLRKPYDDTLRELYVQQYAKIMESVGCLMSQNGKGTIFRVGSKYGMTAAHVVNAIINPHKQAKGDDSRLCKEHVYVSFSEAGLDQSLKYKLAGKVAFINAGLDVAIVEFSEESIKNLPPALSLLTYDACSTSNDVAVIGYGHGNSEFKCLEHSVKVIDPESVPVCDIRKYLQQHYHTFKPILKRLGKDSSSVDIGYTGYKDDHHVLLNAYVGHGASGSPIFTKADPACLQVVGIYTCGYPKLSYELPNTIRFPIEWTFEAGTKMNFIYDALKNENKTLAEDIFMNNEKE